jgi:hypothetical protein
MSNPKITSWTDGFPYNGAAPRDCDCVANSAFKCFRVRRSIPEGETVTKHGGPCTCICHIKDED